MTILGLHLALACAYFSNGADEPPMVRQSEYHYVRVSSKGKTNECHFLVRRADKGWMIRSVTGTLSVVAAYDAKDNVKLAEVTQVIGDKKARAWMIVRADQAEIKAVDGKVFQFEVSPGVIVTSAPDWTDVFLMCRRYDRAKGGKQSFPGLWIHPSKGAFQLTFTIERTGKDTVEHDGKKRMADRYVIHVRNKSEYTAWADEDGLLMRLRPGSKGEPAYEILLDKGSRERKRPE